MKNEALKNPLLSRAAQGAAEGAIFGAVVGLLRGVLRAIQHSGLGVTQVIASLLLCLVVGSVVCCLGRTISGKLIGAWIGAVAGLFLGMAFLDDVFGGYWWTPAIEQPDGSFTTSGQPVGQAIGGAFGAFCGVLLGAFVERLIRRARALVPPTSR